jgi:hypothetical protein
MLQSSISSYLWQTCVQIQHPNPGSWNVPRSDAFLERHNPFRPQMYLLGSRWRLLLQVCVDSPSLTPTPSPTPYLPTHPLPGPARMCAAIATVQLYVKPHRHRRYIPTCTEPSGAPLTPALQVTQAHSVTTCTGPVGMYYTGPEGMCVDTCPHFYPVLVCVSWQLHVLLQTLACPP